MQNEGLPEPNTQFDNFVEGQIVLGKQLENPYTVENMKKAHENLSTNGRSGANIRTTHLYLKFNPQNEEDLDLLKSDTTLEWYDYPLDYEMISGGLFYHDPAIPTNKPTYQYVAVKVDKEVPSVNYEILAELYLPEEDVELTQNGANSTLANALVDEALKLTNNLPEASQSNSTNAKVASNTWNPAGKIQVWDDVIGTHTTTTRVFHYWEYYDCEDEGGGMQMQTIVLPGEQCRRAIYRTETSDPMAGSKIPLAGVKVRARSWFKTRTALTNAQGNYYISFFRNQVNYSIKWERNDYDIRDNRFFQAYFSGPKKKGNWNVDLVSGKALRHATIHRAAHRYFYQNIGGLNPATRLSRLKLAYIDKVGTGINRGYLQHGTLGLYAAIKIWGKNENDNSAYYDTNQIFSTTIHEIAHSMHIKEMAGLVQFMQVDKLIRESWANVVEWFITRLEYNERGVANYDRPNINRDPIRNPADHIQWWDNTVDEEALDYTPIFIDLIDDFNQTTGLNDQITGYTMPTLEQVILKHAYGLTSFRDRLKANRPAGVTNQQIDDYFTYYFNL